MLRLVSLPVISLLCLIVALKSCEAGEECCRAQCGVLCGLLAWGLTGHRACLETCLGWALISCHTILEGGGPCSGCIHGQPMLLGLGNPAAEYCTGCMNLVTARTFRKAPAVCGR